MLKKKDFIEQMQQAHAPIKAMIGMVPDDKLDWAPAKGFMTIGNVLKHLSENWSLMKMIVTNDWPFKGEQEMTEAMKLENLPSCSKAEALAAMENDLQAATTYLEGEISEEDFFQKIVEAPWGFKGEVWKGLMMARDHFINHKMQLFLYLKLLGLPVHSGTLYGM